MPNSNATEPSKPRRCWYQFSREGLLVILVVVAACVGVYFRATRPTRDDEERAKVVEKLKVLGDALKKHDDAYKRFDHATETSNKDLQNVLEKAREK